MVFGQSHGWTHRKKRPHDEDGGEEAAPAPVATEDVHTQPVAPRMTSAQRYNLFAHLAWLTCYDFVYAAEAAANAPLISELAGRFASSYMRRATAQNPEGSQAAAFSSRMQDNSGFLRRAADVSYVPFSQAVRGVAFLAAMTPRPVWTAELRARRVVCRAFVMTLLQTMALCRPPPTFEVHECVSAFVVDQTYARTGGCGTGSSKYRAVEALDADGERRREERLVYMNGFARAVPTFTISDAARRLLEQWGPYTQSFDRVVPHLQPDRLQTVMDDFLRRSVGLLSATTTGHGVDTMDVVRRLLSRPNYDPDGATYLTWLRPLPFVDTKSYNDMLNIIRWLHDFLAAVPLVLILLGDGQTVLRMRDLKRLHPAQHKHVLVCNDGFHSHAHFMFAVFILWWDCYLKSLANVLGKEKVGPHLKNLEHNAWEHSLQFILPIVVATFIFLTRHVTNPPPALLLRDPALYVALVQNASGIVMLEFLRHAGLPVMWWHRAGRAEDSYVLDDVHALAFHTYRTAHKTSSTQISLMHLISIYGTHPELRAFLRRHMFVSQLGRVGASVYSGRAMEVGNEMQKERNLSAAVFDSLLFTQLLQPMMHVYRAWKAVTNNVEPGDIGFRANIEHEVNKLVEFFLQEVGTDLVTRTESNAFWHTGQPRNMRNSDVRESRPWEWVWLVAEGRSRGKGMATTESWWAYTQRHIRAHMFYQ